MAIKKLLKLIKTVNIADTIAKKQGGENVVKDEDEGARQDYGPRRRAANTLGPALGDESLIGADDGDNNPENARLDKPRVDVLAFDEPPHLAHVGNGVGPQDAHRDER